MVGVAFFKRVTNGKEVGQKSRIKVAVYTKCLHDIEFWSFLDELPACFKRVDHYLIDQYDTDKYC